MLYALPFVNELYAEGIILQVLQLTWFNTLAFLYLERKLSMWTEKDGCTIHGRLVIFWFGVRQQEWNESECRELSKFPIIVLQFIVAKAWVCAVAEPRRGWQGPGFARNFFSSPSLNINISLSSKAIKILASLNFIFYFRHWVCACRNI
jgi:hypothetical protein